jgi:predicted Zn-dependent protease
LKRIAETETSQIWKEAFNLKDKPKVITVIPDGAAERGGLQIGDTILSVNDFQWSASDKEQKNFEKELNSAFLLPTMRLVVQRNKDKLALLFTGNDICDVYIHIVNGEGASAYTSNNNHVFIERGMEELMSEDSELAYVVAHEISHAIYGHAAPERKRDLKDKDIRFSMEKEADAMAIRLMVNAGYDTAGAAAAVKKFDYESRGPITRWLDYYGSYMSTEQRIEFLKTTVDEVLK